MQMKGTTLRKTGLPFALAAALLSAFATPAMAADPVPFVAGPVFTTFGAVAKVDSDMPIPANATFKVVFDVNTAGEPGAVNRTFDSAARFINMHVAAGVPERNIHVVVVVHGTASGDLVQDGVYAAAHQGKPNPNAAAIAALIAHGVDFYLCGQSAARYGIARKDLLPGVKVALSAMTVHALLQQQGYAELP